MIYNNTYDNLIGIKIPKWFIKSIIILGVRLKFNLKGVVMVIKKGAMFGLDARIALAIFGALSVISGAALYNAIEKARATSLLTELQELGKAMDAYYLDTGVLPSKLSPDPALWSNFVYKTSNLGKNVDSVANWRGPYTQIPLDAAEIKLQHSLYGFSHIGIYETDDDWYDFLSSNAECDTAGEKCAIWVGFDVITSLELMKSVDRLVDGDQLNGHREGSVRYKTIRADPFRGLILLKYMPTRNPN